jgi:hypothetical protein
MSTDRRTVLIPGLLLICETFKIKSNRTREKSMTDTNPAKLKKLNFRTLYVSKFILESETSWLKRI